jgi:hypothetical protein
MCRWCRWGAKWSVKRAQTQEQGTHQEMIKLTGVHDGSWGVGGQKG